MKGKWSKYKLRNLLHETWNQKQCWINDGMYLTFQGDFKWKKYIDQTEDLAK